IHSILREENVMRHVHALPVDVGRELDRLIEDQVDAVAFIDRAVSDRVVGVLPPRSDEPRHRAPAEEIDALLDSVPEVDEESGRVVIGTEHSVEPKVGSAKDDDLERATVGADLDVVPPRARGGLVAHVDALRSKLRRERAVEREDDGLVRIDVSVRDLVVLEDRRDDARDRFAIARAYERAEEKGERAAPRRTRRYTDSARAAREEMHQPVGEDHAPSEGARSASTFTTRISSCGLRDRQDFPPPPPERSWIHLSIYRRTPGSGSIST